MFWNWTRSIVGIIPLFSGLVQTRPSDHSAAVKELSVTLILTLLPLWVGGWVSLLTVSPKENRFWSAICNSIDQGDLLLFSCSILAPILYIALYKKPGWKEFPSRLSHTIVVFIIVILSSVAFGLKRVGITFDKNIIFSSSIALFSISILLLYIAMAYRNRVLPENPEDMKTDEREFSAEYSKHR